MGLFQGAPAGALPRVPLLAHADRRAHMLGPLDVCPACSRAIFFVRGLLWYLARFPALVYGATAASAAAAPSSAIVGHADRPFRMVRLRPLEWSPYVPRKGKLTIYILIYDI